MKNRLFVLIFLILVSALAMSSCGSCEHNFINGVCANCGESDTDYEAPCEHIYVSGVCAKCGDACSHSYKNSICENCGFNCPHNFTDGICFDCGAPCDHVYSDSECEKCGIACSHEFEEGVCKLCEAEDPDYIPADKGKSLYSSIVDKYKSLVLYKHINEELPPKGSNPPFYLDALYEVVEQYNPAVNLGYSFKDIDCDGYVELLLVENTNRLYAMFTIKDKAPALVATFQQGMGYLGPDGLVFFNAKKHSPGGLQNFLGYSITRLVEGKLTGFSYGREDSADGGDDVYFYISEKGVRTEISYDEYQSCRKRYIYFWEYPTRLTKLNNLKFNPALTDKTITDKIADFSTYDKIIETFAVMHTEVTGGECVKSFWIGGRYDNGMIFESDEDFVVYNRLFAASALAQNSSTASFGYAKSDLNGDGTEELILLESRYNVLAIFTEVGGKAVLLDSYTDLRKAFIDANGLIHVEQKAVLGSTNDCEYYVYKVGEELEEQVAIGVKFDAAGNQSKLYKIESGVVTDIEKTLWDTLFGYYSLDIGNMAFSTYTESKAGLVFVEATAD